jgi:hypothetical protein
LELESHIETVVCDEEQPTEQPETLQPGKVPSDVENTRKVQPIQGTYCLRGRTIIKSMRKLFKILKHSIYLTNFNLTDFN